MTVRPEQLLRHLRRLVARPEPEPATDAALLDRFLRRHDEDAFAALVSRHGPLVLGVCRRVLRDPQRAEDAFQATWLVLARKAGTVRPAHRLAAWLHGVARHLALKLLRDDQRRRQRENRAGLAGTSPAPPDPLDELTARELLAILDQEVQQLPEVYRLPVILCGLEGRSQEEAARLLGWTPGSLKGRLERGRKRLHGRLARRGLALPAALAALEVGRGQAALALPAGLAQTLARAASACAGGEAAAPGVAAHVVELARGGLPGLALGRLGLGVVLGIVAALAVSGAGLLALRPPAVEPRRGGQQAGPEPQEKRRAPQSQGRPRTDRYGDPLPPGALLRLGTLRHRSLHRWDRASSPAHNQPLPDGKTVLTNTSAEVRWVDVGTGRVVRSWPLPTGCTVCGFSPDGRRAVLSDRKTLRLWDLSARRELRMFRGKGSLGMEISARFAPDGEVIVTNSGVNLNPGLVRVWDVASGRELWQEGVMGFWTRGLWPLGFLADGKTLVVVDKSSCRVGLRDRTTGRELRSFATMPRNHARNWALSPDGKAVFIGTDGPAVRVWDLATGRERAPLGGHKQQAHSFTFSRDGKTILTGGGDRLVHVWDWPAGKRRQQIDLGAGRSIESLAVSADGRRAELVVWGESALRFFDLKTGRELPTEREAHRSPVHGLAISSDGKVVTAGTDDTLRVWDLRSGRQLHEHRTGHPVGASALALSADGRLVATTDFNRGTVTLWERDTGRRLRIIDTGGKSAHGVAFAPAGRLLAISGSGSSRPFVEFWDADTGRRVRTLEGAGTGPVFSPDGRLLAGRDGEVVRLWEVASGRERMTLPRREARALAFAPDGRTVACGDAQGITLWELATGKERCRIAVPTERPETLRFSPDGRWLARGDDRAVHLCAVWSGQRVHSFAGHDSAVTRLAFAPDSQSLASASFDTTVLVWDVASVAGRQPRPAARPAPAAVAAAWDDLGSADARAAYRAIGLLTEAAGRSLPLLRERLRPRPAADARQVARWLAALDSNRFTERERATRELERLGDQAEVALRRFLQGRPALETRRRAEGVLARLEGPVTSPERLRPLRALEVLERLGTAEARQVLKTLTQGAPAARLTREAKATLERLTRQSGARP
jgi:RNA polymerase sigma factor (sigma-70 family)